MAKVSPPVCPFRIASSIPGQQMQKVANQTRLFWAHEDGQEVSLLVSPLVWIATTFVFKAAPFVGGSCFCGTPNSEPAPGKHGHLHGPHALLSDEPWQMRARTVRVAEFGLSHVSLRHPGA